MDHPDGDRIRKVRALPSTNASDRSQIPLRLMIPGEITQGGRAGTPCATFAFTGCVNEEVESGKKTTTVLPLARVVSTPYGPVYSIDEQACVWAYGWASVNGAVVTLEVAQSPGQAYASAYATSATCGGTSAAAVVAETGRFPLRMEDVPVDLRSSLNQNLKRSLLSQFDESITTWAGSGQEYITANYLREHVEAIIEEGLKDGRVDYSLVYR